MRLGSCLALLVFIFFCGQVEALEQTQKKDTVILITGCSRGIGLATAERLANQGYLVYATMKNAHDCISSSDNMFCKQLDVTDASSIQSVVNEIIEKEGHLDVLINNAGYALGGPLESLSMQEVIDQMDVNFFGIIRTCQEVLPHMRKQNKGHIINISSVQGVYGLPYGSLYTSSKAALESLSEALSIEVMPWNIHVSIVEPGLVATNFSVKLGARNVEQNPYENIQAIIAAMILEKREPSEFCQSVDEIAKCLQNVIEDPNPKLRYQTSLDAEELVLQWIKDTSGELYSGWMKSQTLQIYQDAWSN